METHNSSPSKVLNKSYSKFKMLFKTFKPAKRTVTLIIIISLLTLTTFQIMMTKIADLLLLKIIMGHQRIISTIIITHLIIIISITKIMLQILTNLCLLFLVRDNLLIRIHIMEIMVHLRINQLSSMLHHETILDQM